MMSKQQNNSGKGASRVNEGFEKGNTRNDISSPKPEIKPAPQKSSSNKDGK